jgi:hypothetical protein
MEASGAPAPLCHILTLASGAAVVLLERLKVTAFLIAGTCRSVLLAALFLVGATPTVAQDNGALLNALIRKGILTAQEAEDIRAEVGRENTSVPAHMAPAHQSTHRFAVGMRMQMQFAHLETDLDNSAFGPAATSHAFLRRMYLTLKGDVGGNWHAVFTYDFAGGGYDEAFIRWTPAPDLAFEFGLRKVDVGHEERASSGNIKAIERSSVTRYFVEANNGRRLGAASYRIGVFFDGRKKFTSAHSLIYSAAITNPERNETFSGAALSGDHTSNKPALWAHVGITAKLADDATWIAGLGSGFLPDQGGVGPENFGHGFDLNLYSIYTEISARRFGLMAEFLMADVERGASAIRDAKPRGFFVQPSLLLTDSIEAVVRYGWLDSDHRGLTLSDVLRSAPSAGTMNAFTEWYAGANWYLRGNDLKFQLGAVHGSARDPTSGAPGEAKTIGVRSQMQIQF